VEGRTASTRESDALLVRLLSSHRGYLLDLSPPNLRIMPAGPIGIDFAVADDHPDWLAQRRLSLRESARAFHGERLEAEPWCVERSATNFRPNSVPPSR
jgi:hypothetical protein